jgi:hypothetical protein
MSVATVVSSQDSPMDFIISTQKREYHWACALEVEKEVWLEKLGQVSRGRAASVSSSEEPPGLPSAFSQKVARATASLSGDACASKKYDLIRSELLSNSDAFLKISAQIKRCNTLLTAFKNSSNVMRQGWLFKTKIVGDKMKGWDRRWFVLMDSGVLYYFKNKADPSPVGNCVVNGSEVAVVDQMVNDVSKKFSFCLSTVDGTTYILCAESQKELTGWIAILTQASSAQNQNPKKSQPAPPPVAILSAVNMTSGGDITVQLKSAFDTFDAFTRCTHRLISRSVLIQKEVGVLKRKMGKDRKLTSEEAMKQSAMSLKNPEKCGWLDKTHKNVKWNFEDGASAGLSSKTTFFIILRAP